MKRNITDSGSAGAAMIVDTIFVNNTIDAAPPAAHIVAQSGYEYGGRDAIVENLTLFCVAHVGIRSQLRRRSQGPRHARREGNWRGGSPTLRGSSSHDLGGRFASNASRRCGTRDYLTQPRSDLTPGESHPDAR